MPRARKPLRLHIEAYHVAWHGGPDLLDAGDYRVTQGSNTKRRFDNAFEAIGYFEASAGKWESQITTNSLGRQVETRQEVM